MIQTKAMYAATSLHKLQHKSIPLNLLDVYPLSTYLPPHFPPLIKILLFRKMKIPSIQPLHPLQPPNTTARNSIRNRRKPHKPSHSRQNNHSTNHPQHHLIMFLDGHHRTPRTLFPTCTGDND